MYDKFNKILNKSTREPSTKKKTINIFASLTKNSKKTLRNSPLSNKKNS